MVAPLALLALLGSAALTTAALHGPKHNASDAERPRVPGAYVVEFADDHDLDKFYGELGNEKIAVSQRLNLSYSLFKGASFQLENPEKEDEAAAQISKMAGIKKIWPVRLVEIPNDEVVWTGQGKDLKSKNVKRQADNTETAWTPHVMTQVDKLRAEGYTGKGVRIGIVDSGVDYTHPALGGCFGEGCLVAYGTDFVGDNYTGSNKPVPDNDPMDCNGHGTHVTGIIAAQPNGLGFTGAAPDVTIGMYRVIGCSATASDDILIAAFNKAYEDGNDIITASIGGASGWSEAPWTVAVQRIVEAGVPCTLAAGNDGSNGLFYSSGAADGDGVSGIASVNSLEIPSLFTAASYAVGNSTAENQPFGWIAGTPSFPNVTMPLYAVSNNSNVTDDACNPLPDGTPDLSNFIPLVRQGTCAWDTKAQNVADKGAKYMMAYSDGLYGVQSVYVAYVPEMLGAGMVTAEVGEEWIKLLTSGEEVRVSITDVDHAGWLVENEADPLGGFVSTFSSWGPTWEVKPKPDFGTPGGNILSTYPMSKGEYAVMSGTSMATPLAAAIHALLGQARGSFNPTELRTVLATTANANLWNDGTTTGDVLAPVPQQGSGLVQAYTAARLNTLLSETSISFNDTANFISNVTFGIQNLGNEEVTYTLSHIPSLTMYTFDGSSIYPAFFPNPIANGSNAELSFSESKVMVSAHGNATVTVSVTPPSGLDESRLPVYNGFIAVNGTNGDALSIPYLGVVGSMYSAPKVIDPDYAYLTNWSDSSLSAVAANQTFTVPNPKNITDPASPPVAGYPAILVQLNVGTPIVRADVVALDYLNGTLNTTEVLGVQTVGSVYGFPREWIARRYFVSSFTGILDDGKVVPEGKYAVVIRALKIFGDRDNVEDYETYRTVPFELKYAS